jgi:2-polyprenyl-6-methoxyphenol hydroxylase-like FAD-dependent oxidoreductase
VIAKGEFAHLRGEPFENVRDRLLALVPARVREAAVAQVRGFSDFALLPVVSQLATAWTAPGLLLLGDAAHPMSPIGGQGINVAIQDAVVAARALVPALASGDHAAIDAAARVVEAARKPPVERIARQQNFVPAVLRLVGPGLLARAVMLLADVTVRRSGKLPAFTRSFVRRLMWGDPVVRADIGPWTR